MKVKIIVQSQRSVRVLYPVLQDHTELIRIFTEKGNASISRELLIQYSEVAGVVGFYTYFSTKPKVNTL
jgi:NADH-quinone oxidoreductase subunit E